MIRAVFFDASGVLYDRARPTEEFAEEFVRAAGFVRAPDAAERARQGELRHAATIGAADHLAYWRHFLRVRGVPAGERERELLEAILAQNDRVHAKPGGRETLGGLRARGILTGAITDTMYPLASKLRWLAAAGVEACSTSSSARARWACASPTRSSTPGRWPRPAWPRTRPSSSGMPSTSSKGRRRSG